MPVADSKVRDSNPFIQFWRIKASPIYNSISSLNLRVYFSGI